MIKDNLENYKMYNSNMTLYFLDMYKIQNEIPQELVDINIISDIIIATIVRNDKIIIPSGDDKLEIGDRVIVITKREKLSNINDIVSGGHR